MSFFEWLKSNSAELGAINPPFRIASFGSQAVFLEGVIGLLEYQTDKIVVQVKKGQVTVNGENLIIKNFAEGDLLVCGKILSIENSLK